MIRPSGTEPKLKAYLEVVEPVDRRPRGRPGRARTAACDALRAEVAALIGGPGADGR